MEFDPNLGTTMGENNVVSRTNRYTWAYMLRRPKFTDPTVVEMAVVVYNNRPLVATPMEPSYTFLAGNQGDTSLTIGYTGTRPPLRVGGWILDANSENLASGNAALYGPVHSFFYQVVSINDTGSSLVLELQTPLLAPLVPNASTIIVMPDVTQVFIKGAGWKTTSW